MICRRTLELKKDEVINILHNGGGGDDYYAVSRAHMSSFVHAQ